MNDKPEDVGYWAVIPAAGAGKRMQSDMPKQYLEINNKTILEHTLEKFYSHPLISRTVVAISADDSNWDRLSVSQHDKVVRVEGGEERCHSVLNCLNYIISIASEHDWVLVHDAARPCLRIDDLNKLIETLSHCDSGGILALPVSDTMKRSDNKNRVLETVDRRTLWRALTPQMFRLGSLMKALSSCIENNMIVTDEAQAIEINGGEVLLIEGHPDNIKITRESDLTLAKHFIDTQVN